MIDEGPNPRREVSAGGPDQGSRTSLPVVLGHDPHKLATSDPGFACHRLQNHVTGASQRQSLEGRGVIDQPPGSGKPKRRTDPMPMLSPLGFDALYHGVERDPMTMKLLRRARLDLH